MIPAAAVVALALFQDPPQPAPKEKEAEIPAAELGSAVHRGVLILIARQERYSERVAEETKARPGDPPPREWPYEGVYRVGGEIPIGYRIGIDPERRSGKGFEAVEGAIGRSPACEVTLALAGRGSVDRIRAALDDFFRHWEWLEKRRKQTGTHAPPYMIAPYYFFYAHRHAAQAIEMLPEAERAGRRQQLHRLLWKVREEDGGWNDRVFPRSECFGTAMTILALLSPGLPPPARWPAK